VEMCSFQSKFASKSYLQASEIFDTAEELLWPFEKWNISSCHFNRTLHVLVSKNTDLLSKSKQNVSCQLKWVSRVCFT